MLHLQGLHIFSTSTPLVSGLDLNILAGQCSALVGESGSGKSLSALALMDLLPSGIRAEGAGLAEARALRRAMVFQEPMTALNPTMRVGEQIAEAARARGKSAPEAKVYALDWMARVQLPEPELSFRKYPHQMSGGQRQRIMIAMAMAQDPELLIADEPTTALDHTVAHDILRLLRALQQSHGFAMLFISHDLDAVAAVADNVYVLRSGECVEQGPLTVVLAQPQHAYTQGLLASRPPENRKPLRLPTVQDFIEGRQISDLERPTYVPSEVILEVRALSKAFAGIPVLHDLDLVLHEGETLGLVGASGSGKSTIARCLVNLAQPDGGEILYRGQRIDGLHRAGRRAMAREIQYIFQDPFSSLSPRMRIGEAIQEAMHVHQLWGDAAQQKIKVLELLEAVGLPQPSLAYDKYPHEFSGGQRQRIGIARTLAVDPRVIICDESVAALDVSVQAQVLNVLNDLKDRFQFSYLFISHDARVVRYMSDRTIVLGEELKG
ncbi:MAG: ABC transporter ATP-binding protein [Schleiferiaceae bacterium]|nr:ABC transporter ATP-binding protein [Schleiferiaceae bacterium]